MKITEQTRKEIIEHCTLNRATKFLQNYHPHLVNSEKMITVYDGKMLISNRPQNDAVAKSARRVHKAAYGWLLGIKKKL